MIRSFKKNQDFCTRNQTADLNNTPGILQPQDKERKKGLKLKSQLLKSKPRKNKEKKKLFGVFLEETKVWNEK